MKCLPFLTLSFVSLMIALLCTCSASYAATDDPSSVIDVPPPLPVVSPAEWEPVTGVLIRYPLDLYLPLIAEMSQDVVVETIVHDSTVMNQAISQYQAAGVIMRNCTWLIANTESVYTRDYGPWYIFQGQNVQGIVDQEYDFNQRPGDNRIPRVIGIDEQIPVYHLNLHHWGGNYMSDGMGKAISSDLVYDENSSLPPEQVNRMMNQYLGVDYQVLDDILSWGSHHIDCWAKLLDPGRVMVKRITPLNQQLEANADILAHTMSSYRRPYEVTRLEAIFQNPYLNVLFLNGKVLVPMKNVPADSQAIRTWQSAMPGYEVLGFDGFWLPEDALHCRTMGITDRYMLRIVHVPLFDQVNQGMGYPIIAEVHAYSNQPLFSGMPKVMWKLANGAIYNPISMTHTTGDTFIGYIPQQAADAVVDYYITASDNSGRTENHPYIGFGNPHQFRVIPADGVNLTMTPVNPPIVIPAGGGSFDFNLSIANGTSNPEEFWCWAALRLPNGVITEPVMGPCYVDLAADSSISRLRTQTLAGTYPPGEYTYVAYIGDYSVSIMDSGSFTFTKSTLTSSDPFCTDLCNTGESISTLSNPFSIPEDFSLDQNYPNPFNPTTTITYLLPFATFVNLSIYDISGKKVAELVNGLREASTQQVTFDGSNLASGVYLCRLDAGGYVGVQKMVLVK
jgi:agmatine deiminase